MSHDHAVIVKGEQVWIGHRRYDVGVYGIGERFYATWFCDPCSMLLKTPECDSLELARQAALDAIQGHHRVQHTE